MPIYNTIPSDEYSNIHYDGESFNMYNPPNTIKQSLEETQNWLNEVPIKSSKSLKSRKQNSWIPLNIQSQNQEYNIYNPPDQMKRDIEQFYDEFDENNIGMREPEHNLLETGEDLELLDIDEEEV